MVFAMICEEMGLIVGLCMVVAVLDTGLDSSHTAFSPDNFTSDHLGMTYQDVAAVVGKTVANKQYGGLSVDDVYINEKVPFGYDYADNDPDVYSTHNNHGTHVSGVIVGKDDGITGVAPNAQLVIMKTFSDGQDTARSAWILAALDEQNISYTTGAEYTTLLAGFELVIRAGDFGAACKTLDMGQRRPVF